MVANSPLQHLSTSTLELLSESNVKGFDGPSYNFTASIIFDITLKYVTKDKIKNKMLYLPLYKVCVLKLNNAIFWKID